MVKVVFSKRNSNMNHENEWNEVNGNRIHKTAIVYPNVIMGTGNYIGPYSVIGANSEEREHNKEGHKGNVIIGDNNFISEFVAIHRPFDEGHSTIIGSRNKIMTHVHIGHHAEVKDDCEICPMSTLGGYCIIHSGARLKVNSTIRNRKIVGVNAVVGMCSAVTKNVPPYTTVYGNPAREHPVLRG